MHDSGEGTTFLLTMARLLPATLLALSLLGGCFDNTYIKEDRSDRRLRIPRVTDHVGGSHDCVLVRDRVWYVGHGPKLLVLEGRGGKPARTENAGPRGETGAVVDLREWRGDLVGVVDGDAVVRWDLGVPRAPMLIDRVESDALGIRPRTLSMVGNELFIAGDGGVVRASDGIRFLSDAAVARDVVATSQGLAAVVGRRIRCLADGRFLGAASMLATLPDEAGLKGGFAFVLQATEGATVGLMGSDLRERVGHVIRGSVRAMRLSQDRLWVITDTDMTSWSLRDGGLHDVEYVKIKGARDLAPLTANLFAVVGSFGRAVYRLHEDRDGAGDEFTDVQREPGRLDQSVFDGRRVMAGSVEGFWLYPIRGKATISDRTTPLTQVPERRATVAWATGRIDDGDGKEETPDESRVLILEGADGKAKWSPPNQGWISTVVAVDGDLWVGHSEGISVLRRGSMELLANDEDETAKQNRKESTLAIEVVASMRIPGPVIWLYPLRTGGGVAWVSRFGGMGVAELAVDESSTAKPSTG